MRGNKCLIVLMAALAGVMASGSPAAAIECGNLSNLPGNYGTWPGEATASFFVDSAASTTGRYAIRIGADAADDFALGVLIPTVSENLRDGYVYTPSAGFAGGRYTIVTTIAQAATPTAGDVDVSAAYFPFSEGWTAGYATRVDGALTGAMDTLTATGGLQMGTHYYDNGSGVNQIWIPGVNPFTDGILLGVNLSGDAGAANPHLYAMTQANYDGSFSLMSHPNNRNGVNYYTSPVGFVFLPYDTPGMVLGQVTGCGGVVNGSGNFTASATETDGVVRLSLGDYTPTQGTLIVTPAGGRYSTDDDVLTYQIVGNDYEITLRDLSGSDGSEPALSYGWGRTAFSFAFIPFDQTPTAPGPPRQRVDHTAQVTAANVAVTEFSGVNTQHGMESAVAQSTARVTMINMNRGDNAIAIDGNHARFQDGVMLATVREDFRSNYATGGGWGVGVACPFAPDDGGPDGWGWEVSTQVADAANRMEFNVNFAVGYFPFKQGWAAGVAEPTENATGQDVLTVKTAGVDSRTDGLLFVNGFGNTDTYAAASPTATGDGWNVNVYGINGRNWENKNAHYNYVYLPYGEEATKNVIMGSVSADGVVQSSQGTGFTVTPETGASYPGVYRLHIDGKTPEDGMLLLTATTGGEAAGNAFLVYEQATDGSGDFLIHGYQGTYVDPAAPGPGEAQAKATGFNFAFVDFANAPALGSAAENPFGTEPVAFARWQIQARDGYAEGYGTVPIITRMGTSDAQFDLWPDQADSNRADLQVKYKDGNLAAARGVILTQVCENRRDNSGVIVQEGDDLALPPVPAVYGANSWGISAPSITGNGYEISTHTSNADAAVWDEFDCNVVAAVFPYNSGFQVGYQPILDGVYQLRLPGSGDTRKDGVLIGNALGNEASYVSMGATADGLGWIVRCHNKAQAYRGIDFGYAYLPFGTENLTAGIIGADGGRLAWTGDFLIEQVYQLDGTTIVPGTYRLTIKDESPDTGVLLLTSSEWNNSSDNILTYAPDGNSFLIHGLDTNDAGQATMSNTEFSFAFLKYAAPVANPTLRAPLDLTKASAGNFVMTQYGTGNNNAEVDAHAVYDPVTFKRQATERFAISNSNRGDLDLALDGERISLNSGILMGTARTNGHDNGDGDGTRWGIVNMNVNEGDLNATAWLAVGRMGPVGVANTNEYNCPVATAFFDFEGNWTGGYLQGSNGAFLVGGLGTYNVSRTATGQYTVSIDGVNSHSDGLLFTIAGTNGDEIVAIDTRLDGNGWDLGVYDGQAGNLGTYVNGDIGFLYLPFGKFEGYEIENLLAGEIGADGSVLMHEGAFTLAYESTGTYRLSIADESPETGMLLLSVNDLEDNLLSYQADGTDFLIKSNDLGNGAAGLLEDVSFNFAFIGFDDPMRVVEATTTPKPGDANNDGKVDKHDAALLAAHWLMSTGAVWGDGDFNDDGAVDDLDLAILAANWGGGAGGGTVPEPAMLVLMITLAAGFAIRYRRRG